MVTFGIIGYWYFVDPGHREYSRWLLPVTFLMFTGSVFLAMLVRSKLSAKHNL